MNKTWIAALSVLALLVGCVPSPNVVPGAASASPTATASPMPEPTQSPTTTATLVPEPTASPTSIREPVDWVPLEDTDNLALHLSWICAGGKIVDGGLALEAGGDYMTVINTLGPQLSFEQDVGVTATIEVASGDWGAFVLFGALPQGAWWKEIKRLDLGWDGARVNLTFWDGTRDSPRFTQSLPSSVTSSRAQVGLRVEGDQLIVLVDGQQVGKTDDPGLFPDGRAYLGANVPPGGRLVIHDISVETVRGKETSVRVETPAGTGTYAPSVPSLRELADARDVLVGAAVAPGPLRCEAPYAQALAHEFNILTTENAMKFGPIHPAPDRYLFDDADAIVDFAEANDMLVRGHTLVWHQQLPGWVESAKWTREELMAVLRDHITTVVGRYRGRVDVWDVVNEAIDKGRLRETVWKNVIGPEYLDLAFQWAHEADPEALLFYNDYGGEGMNAKSDAIYELVRGMVERGVPIHGVGLQMHVSASSAPASDRVLENMNRLADLGLQVHITELDVRIQGDPTESKLERQARDYGTIAETCLEAKDCTALIIWGFTDRYSWVPASFSGWGSALILDTSYQPKPAYTALQEALKVP